MRKISIVFILFFVSFGLSAQIQRYSKVKIYTDAKSLEKLASLGIPVEGKYKKDTYLITEISENDVAKLSANGFVFEVLIDNMAEFYVDRNAHPEKYKTVSPKSTDCTGSPVTYTTPSHYTLGSMGGYYTYQEMLAQLDSMRAYFPNIVSVKQQAGTITTIEGRKLYYVRISDNPDTDETEPEVLYGALTHAREPMSMQQLIFYMWYLLENYNTDNEIHQLLDNTELYFVPIVNPDGYEYNYSNYPSGGGLWRKNRSDNGNGDYGVDINRNYGYQWGYDDIGSSYDPSSDSYRGTGAFSESETQIMKWFCEHRQFVLAIDYHCYGNYLIYPWGYKADWETSDSLLYMACSKVMTAENGFVYGTPSQTVNYTGNGGSLDWLYGEQSTKGKIICWSPEAGNADDGFYPAINKIEDIAKTNVLQNLYVARFAGKYAELSDKTPLEISLQNGYFKFDIQRLGHIPATFTVSIQPLSSTVQSVGAQKVYSGMNLPETRTDSISYTLDPNIQNGETVEYLLTVDNGSYSVSDTVVKIFGQPTDVFTDNCGNMNNWTGGWGVTTASYYSATSSITDSPGGNYSDDANNLITLKNEFSLSGAVAARLNFRAKWEIEKGYDYVQVSASADGGLTWTPLCGKYTNPGTSDQAEGEPLYDGVQDTWVLEDIDLSAYIGQTVKLHFSLVSDAHKTYDGFYFDDIDVLKIDSSHTLITEGFYDDVFISDPVPNPAENITVIRYKLPENIVNPEIIVCNELGQIVLSEMLNNMKGQITLEIKNLHKGVYYYRVISPGITSGLKKMVVI